MQQKWYSHIPKCYDQCTCLDLCAFDKPATLKTQKTDVFATVNIQGTKVIICRYNSEDGHLNIFVCFAFRFYISVDVFTNPNTNNIYAKQ